MTAARSVFAATTRRSVGGVRVLGCLLTAALAVGIWAAPAVADGPGYRFFKTAGAPTRPGAFWNPCQTVRYGIDFTYAQRKGLRRSWERDRWRSAVAEVGDAMGVTFRYAGSVQSRSGGRYPRPARGADIVITYGRDARKGRYAYGRVLKGSVAGVGGVRWWGTSRPGRARIHFGYVVIDAADVMVHTSNWQAPFDSRPADQRPPDAVRALYMHEFGHAVGLNHVRDTAQLMYPQLQASRPDVLGPGDRRGLRKLGRQRCF